MSANNPNIWTPNATEAGVANCNPDLLNSNLEYLKYEQENLNIDTDSLKEQCINSFNDSPDTTNIFDVSAANLTENFVKAGIRFNTVVGGLKHRYYLTEDVAIPALEVNKTYFPVLKVKDTAKYKRELLASDVEIILLNQPMLWKTLAPSENLALQTDGSTITDKWGNTVQIQGNPTIVDGQLVCDGTGDYLKIPTITNLGNEGWIIQTAVKFNSTTAQMMIVRSKAVYGFILQKTAANKLALALSSNGTTWDISNSVLGTKADWNTTTKYWYRLISTSTQYLVQWSTDTTNGIDGTWTTDITVTSSLKVYGSLGALMFGVYYDEAQYFLNGSIDIANTKVVVGNTYVQDSGRFNFNGENAFIGYPADYTQANAVPAIMLGELTTDSTQVVNTITYGFNGTYISTPIACTGGVVKTIFNHNLGTKLLKNFKFLLICIVAEDGYNVGDIIVPSTSPAANFVYSFSPCYMNAKQVSVITGANSAYYTINNSTGINAGLTASNWNQLVIAERI